MSKVVIFPNATLLVRSFTVSGAPTHHEAVRETDGNHDGDTSVIIGDRPPGRQPSLIRFGFDNVPANLPDINYGSLLITVIARGEIAFDTPQEMPLLTIDVLGTPTPTNGAIDGRRFTLIALPSNYWGGGTFQVDFASLTKADINALELELSPDWGFQNNHGDRVRITAVCAEFLLPPVGKTSHMRWEFKDAVGISSQLRWTVRPAAAHTSKIRWTVDGVAAKRSKILWKVLKSVGKTSKIRWGVREEVGVTSQIRWDTAPCSFLVSRIRWHIGGTVGVTSQIRWGIRDVADPVTSQIRWKVLESAGITSKIRWDVYSLAAAKSRIRWLVTEPFAVIDDVLILDTVCDDQPDTICHPYVTLQVVGQSIYQVTIKNGDAGYGEWIDYGEGLFDVNLEAGEGEKTVCVRARNIDLVETPEQCTTITVEVGDQLRQLQDNLPAIYSTQRSGLLYELLSSWAVWLCHASRSIDSAIDQGNLNLAVGQWLDQWGYLTGIGRKIGESDAAFRARLITWLVTDKVTLRGLHTLANTEIGLGELRFRELTQFPCYLVGDLSGAGDYDFASVKQAIDLVKPAGVKVIWHGGDYFIEIIPIDDDILGGADEARYIVRVHSIGGFHGMVTLSAGELPEGYTASFSVNPVDVPPNGTVDSLLIIQPTITIPSFTIEVIPELIELEDGVGEFTVRVCSVGGFSGSVALSDSMLPDGYSGSFDPETVDVPAGGCVESILTVQRD